AARRTKPDVGPIDFVLCAPPGPPGKTPPAEPPPGAITPIATTNLPAGESWAAFVSGRLGDPNDLWLAHGRDGRWTEFLFTGQSFPRSERYGYSGTSPEPTSGSCVIEVKGDQVVLRAPNANLAAEE